MIGIIDWGIGGLGVYSALREAGKTTDVLYLSDSGTTPYGKMNKQQLRNRFELIAKYFSNSGCLKVLVACNAASSALEDKETFGGIEFVSIIPAAITAINGSSKRIGVIGGIRTIESGIYQSRLTSFDCIFTSAQPLSALVEAGQLEGELVEREIARVMTNLNEVDELLLACTHYPALSPVFKKLYPGLKLFDPANTMISMVELDSGNNNFSFVTTGDLEASIESAYKAFGVKISSGKTIKVE